MWMRFDATTRRPPSSSILVTAPVRLRRVASGLMIENVRVTAIGLSLGYRGDLRAPLAAGARRRKVLRTRAIRLALHLTADKVGFGGSKGASDVRATAPASGSVACCIPGALFAVSGAGPGRARDR